MVEELLGHASDQVADGHTRHFKRFMEEIRAFPGAKELLEEVHRRGAKVVLATSASTDQLAAMLAALELSEGVVDHRTNKDDVEQSKPAPSPSTKIPPTCSPNSTTARWPNCCRRPSGLARKTL